jgi:hypothetical protein
LAKGAINNTTSQKIPQKRIKKTKESDVKLGMSELYRLWKKKTGTIKAYKGQTTEGKPWIRRQR